jgi:hypothetical protein
MAQLKPPNYQWKPSKSGILKTRLSPFSILHSPLGGFVGGLRSHGGGFKVALGSHWGGYRLAFQHALGWL